MKKNTINKFNLRSNNEKHTFIHNKKLNHAVDGFAAKYFYLSKIKL